MLLDWLLASLHHLAAFTLAGILAAEIALTTCILDDPAILRPARVDAWFGVMAALALASFSARKALTFTGRTSSSG